MEAIILTKKVKHEIMYDIAEAVIIKAKDMVPVDQGDLLASIKYKIEENKIIIYSDNEHASDMEYGAPPTVLSPSEKGQITKWSQRHGIENPKGTSKYIETHGIEVGTVDNPLHVIWQGRNSYRPFFRPAIHQTIPEFKKIVKEVLL